MTEDKFNRKGMGEKGYNFVIENFDWKKLSLSYIKIFNSVLK